jgi:hypothetical protein
MANSLGFFEVLGRESTILPPISRKRLKIPAFSRQKSITGSRLLAVVLADDHAMYKRFISMA